MPRKTKELDVIEKPQKKVAKKTSKTTKKVSEKLDKKSTVSKAKVATTKKAAASKTKSTVEKKVATTKAKATTTKKATASKAKASVEKKAASPKAKVTSAKKSTTSKAKTSPAKKVTSSKAKVATAKKSTTSKVKTSSTKNVASSKAKVATAKKSTTSKTKTSRTTSTKKSTTTKVAKSASKKAKEPSFSISNYTPEYYDLPFRYNQTIVKILAQTPNSLFIYWDISDEDRQSLKNTYGNYFFEITKPVLIIHNKTLNYSFEIDINDFANSWYLHVNDSNCEYQIELGRRPIPINYSYMPEYDVEKNGPIKSIETSYIYISSSNDMISPNDKILFNLANKILFRHIKTNEIIERDISEFSKILAGSQFIDVYQLYNNLFKDEILRNPSSGNPGSGSFPLRFR